MEHERKSNEETLALERADLDSEASRSPSPSSDLTEIAGRPTIAATYSILTVMLNSWRQRRPVKTRSPSHGLCNSGSGFS
jgi:hypothetical protein